MFRQKLGQLNGDKTRLTTENTQLTKDLQALQTQLKALGAERDAIKAMPATDSSQHIVQELEKIRKEKVALEQALQQEKAQKAESSSGAAGQAALVVSSLSIWYRGMAVHPRRHLLPRSGIACLPKRRLGRQPPQRHRLEHHPRSGRPKRLSSSKLVTKLLHKRR